MGLETTTIARVRRKRYEGKLHLDSKLLSFKSTDFRCCIELDASVEANSSKGLLVVQNGDIRVSFEIGDKADAWVAKILYPPNRITKLGVKSNQKIWVGKGFSKAFTGELKQQGASLTKRIESCDLAFWKATDREQLVELPALTRQIPAGTNIWIVWTKGSQTIGQTDVMNATKALQFGPSKTAAFDDKHSSMRFARKK